MSSSRISPAPSAEKAILVRRFLVASGIQAWIDSGSFLDSYALHSPILVASGGSVSAIVDALRAAYEPHRSAWQEEYESHINWEFGDAELQDIVDFLESSSGQHFLEGRWRMDAYIGSNTEPLVEEIVSAASVALKKSGFPSEPGRADQRQA